MKKIKAFAFLYLAIAIALGALGAHGLKPKLSAEDLEVFKTGVLYHLIIALVLIAQGAALKKSEVLMLVFGSLMFSVSLYAITILKSMQSEIPSGVGIITPIGGLLMIFSLILISVRLWQNKNSGL